MPSLYEIPLQSLQGQPTSLQTYAGKVLLIVNVASKCGLTPQYTALEQLFQRYKDRGLVILGFPANDFAGQEPGSNEEIATFCSTEYPVTFPLLAKTAVTGPDKHALYKELTAAQPTRTTNDDSLHTHLAEYASAHGFPAPNAPPELLWNFEKFLLNRKGEVVARFNPDMTPDDPKIVQAIEGALAAE